MSLISHSFFFDFFFSFFIGENKTNDTGEGPKKKSDSSTFFFWSHVSSHHLLQLQLQLAASDMHWPVTVTRDTYNIDEIFKTIFLIFGLYLRCGVLVASINSISDTFVRLTFGFSPAGSIDFSVLLFIRFDISLDGVQSRVSSNRKHGDTMPKGRILTFLRNENAEWRWNQGSEARN